jgi:predicted DNA binding CopG/RHH family protein
MPKANPELQKAPYYQLRLPAALHSQLKDQAAQQGVTMQTLIVSLLAGSIGWNLNDHPSFKLVPATRK